MKARTATLMAGLSLLAAGAFLLWPFSRKAHPRDRANYCHQSRFAVKKGAHVT